MAGNTDVAATWRYHDGTKHSLQSVRASARMLDWDNLPIPYKIYSTLPPISLPVEFPASSVPALDAIAATDRDPGRDCIPDLAQLARLCYFANGVTKVLRGRGPAGEMAFRAAACTGALYHVELYLVCGDLLDLPAGVYHYGAHDHGLRRLREGDFRRVLIEATGSEPSIARAPVIAISTSTFWRNAWKYESRAYRHTFWDSGTILANVLAEAASQKIPVEIVLGFADAEVNQLIGADGNREAAVSLLPIGRASEDIPSAPTLAPLDLPTVPLSRHEVDYPAIRTMHAASSLTSADEAAAWRGEPNPQPAFPVTGAVVPLQPIPDVSLPRDPIETVIRRRGSTRRFTRDAITYPELSTVLDRATRGIPADCLDPGRPLSTPYLIVNAVEGLPSGAYIYHRAERALEQLRAGSFRDQAGDLALGQELAADAAVNIYFLSDLASVLARFGNRGYRAAQLEAAITAGKLYLAAYALRLGATGLTFFDDDVTGFFSPRAEGQSVMFLITLGHPWKRFSGR